MPGELRPLERRKMDEWRADVLDRVAVDALPGYQRNRVLMRRAAVWASLAYQRARQGEAAEGAAHRALAELASVDKTELAEEDRKNYSEAAMRVSASRWASARAPSTPSQPLAPPKSWPHIVALPGEPGQTCIVLVGTKNDEKNPLARRCTYGIVWTIHLAGGSIIVAGITGWLLSYVLVMGKPAP